MTTTGQPGAPLARYAARRVGDLVYFSGVIAVDPASREVIERFDQLDAATRALLGESGEMSIDVYEAPALVQSFVVLDRIRELAQQHGGSMASVFKLVQYFTDLRDYPLYARVRRHFYPAEPPVSTVVQVSGLLPSPRVRIEVEGTAHIPLAPEGLMHARTLTLRVARIGVEAEGVKSFEFVHPRGLALPGYEPGAHIEVHTPGGYARTYSLARAAPPEGLPMRYVIGVKREAGGRGGSAALHDAVQEGDLLGVGSPRNAFPMPQDAQHLLLVAGGIGLTPLLAMAEQRARDGAPFTLALFARSRAHVPFADALAVLAPHVRLHFDDEAAAEKIDLPALFDAQPRAAQLMLQARPAS